MPVARIFVYGTLLRGERNHRIIKPFADRIEAATTSGRLFVLPQGYPGLLPGPDTVRGECVALRDPQAALAALDDLEEYFGPDHPDNEYRRVNIEIRIAGRTSPAWTYFYARPLPVGARLIPSGDWRAIDTGRDHVFGG